MFRLAWRYRHAIIFRLLAKELLNEKDSSFGLCHSTLFFIKIFRSDSAKQTGLQWFPLHPNVRQSCRLLHATGRSSWWVRRQRCPSLTARTKLPCASTWWTVGKPSGRPVLQGRRAQRQDRRGRQRYQYCVGYKYRR